MMIISCGRKHINFYSDKEKEISIIRERLNDAVSILLNDGWVISDSGYFEYEWETLSNKERDEVYHYYKMVGEYVLCKSDDKLIVNCDATEHDDSAYLNRFGELKHTTYYEVEINYADSKLGWDPSPDKIQKANRLMKNVFEHQDGFQLKLIHRRLKCIFTKKEGNKNDNDNLEEYGLNENDIQKYK